MPFFHDRSLLADLMQCGVQMLSKALSWFKKVPLEAGYVVVLETAGRAGNWNPHLHILMTSGGVTPENRWREVELFSLRRASQAVAVSSVDDVESTCGHARDEAADRCSVAEIS